eukprot:scaffold94401_cov33-Tisochrysis_lutea.AAC.3
MRCGRAPHGRPTAHDLTLSINQKRAFSTDPPHHIGATPSTPGGHDRRRTHALARALGRHLSLQMQRTTTIAQPTAHKCATLQFDRHFRSDSKIASA